MPRFHPAAPVRRPRPGFGAAPFDWGRARWKRQAAEEFPIPLTHHKRYVLFSWSGLTQWALLFVLLLLALNYANNVAMVCVCFLMLLRIQVLLLNYSWLQRVVLTGMEHRPHDDTTGGSVVFHAAVVPEGWNIDPTEDRPDADPRRARTTNPWALPRLVPNALNRWAWLRPLAQAWRRVRPISWPVCHLVVDGQTLPLLFAPDRAGVARAQATWSYDRRPAGLYEFPRVVPMTWWPTAVSRTWMDIKVAPRLAIAPSASGADTGISDRPADHTLALPKTAAWGDPAGVRALGPHERAVRLAWRPTLRHGVPIVPTWEAADEAVVRVRWPDDGRPAVDQARAVRPALDAAVAAGRLVQLMHPRAALPAGRGPAHVNAALAAALRTDARPEPWPAEDAAHLRRAADALWSVPWEDTP